MLIIKSSFSHLTLSLDAGIYFFRRLLIIIILMEFIISQLVPLLTFFHLKTLQNQIKSNKIK